MVQFVHPSRQDITLAGVLAALADPMRLRIVKSLLVQENDCMSYTEAMPCPGMAKSTLSNHFRILREAGLIQTTKASTPATSCARPTSMRGFQDC